MSDTIQQGILCPIPQVGRYLFFAISDADQVARVLCDLRDVTNGRDVVVGLGQSLALSLGKSIKGLKHFPSVAALGLDVPSTPAALWCWLRSDDRGEITLRSGAIERMLTPAFELVTAVNAFLYGNDLDLSGYEDGTANPTGENAVEAAFVSGHGRGLDGASFVAVQQWLHDFDKLTAIPPMEMDNIMGRRKVGNEELEDAPPSSHVKRTDQESFNPAAHILRRSAPWSDERRAGLLFAAFGRSLDAFELQLHRMVGTDDGVIDGLFRFTRPITGAYFWCPAYERWEA